MSHAMSFGITHEATKESSNCCKTLHLQNFQKSQFVGVDLEFLNCLGLIP